MIDQLQRISLTSRAFRNDKLGIFYKKLSDMTGYEMSLPMNSGAEAVETAIKVARKWGYAVKGIPKYDAEIIVAAGNFHGRTVTIVSFSTEPLYKDAFGPFTPGFKVVPFGDLGALEAAISPNHRRGDVGTHSGRKRRHHPSGRLPSRRAAELCKRTTSFSSPMKSRPDLGARKAVLPPNTKMCAPDSHHHCKALLRGVVSGFKRCWADKDVLD
jgi:ornithine--oxo-acid transaminase